MGWRQAGGDMAEDRKEKQMSDKWDNRHSGQNRQKAVTKDVQSKNRNRKKMMMSGESV